MNFFKHKIDKTLGWLALHPVITRLSVTKKIVTAYVLIALFSLVAIFYAISSLHHQMTVSTDLVHKDAKAVAMSRDLQGNLKSQERLEKQYLILPKDETLALLREKYEDFPRLWSDFLPLLDTKNREELTALYVDYSQKGEQFLEQLQQPIKGDRVEAYFEEQLLPAHLAFYKKLSTFREPYQLKIDAGLEALAEKSSQSFQITFMLLLIGFFLATPVAISVVLSIHYSLRRLTSATQQIAAGNYDVEFEMKTRDEFGLLAQEFLEMSRKLREFEISNLDANPLTHLPGNLVIQRRVEELIRDDIPFAHAFVDLDHFKAYNDRYGYQNGSDIITIVGEIIDNVIRDEGNEDDFVGHIGGDDYIFLTSPDKVEKISAEVIDRFEKMIPDKYSEEDKQAGFFICQDRFGVERQFPLMTISIAIICSDTSNYTSAIAISHECAKMKEHLKRLPGSNYLIDRRRGKS